VPMRKMSSYMADSRHSDLFSQFDLPQAHNAYTAHAPPRHRSNACDVLLIRNASSCQRDGPPPFLILLPDVSIYFSVSRYQEPDNQRIPHRLAKKR
jgi:hypothetical protein